MFLALIWYAACPNRITGSQDICNLVDQSSFFKKMQRYLENVTIEFKIVLIFGLSARYYIRIEIPHDNKTHDIVVDGTKWSSLH